MWRTVRAVPAQPGGECSVAAEVGDVLLDVAVDYLKGEWEVAKMEVASFNARRAANVVLDAAGSHEPPAAAIGTYRQPEWERLKEIA